MECGMCVTAHCEEGLGADILVRAEYQVNDGMMEIMLTSRSRQLPMKTFRVDPSVLSTLATLAYIMTLQIEEIRSSLYHQHEARDLQ